MSVTIKICSNTSDENVIHKNYTENDTYTGYFKDSADIINPIITVAHAGPVNGNYAYIEDLDRYYYIDDQTITSATMVQLSLRVDVLMSNASAIDDLQCEIENSTNVNSNYLASDLFVNLVKTKTDVLQFPSGFNDEGEYILITAGG